MTREEAIKILRTRIVPIKNWQETHEAINMAINALQAEEVVRCRDCRWFDKGENEVDTWSICTRTMGIRDIVIDIDYCSFAERREEGEVEE